MFKKIFKSFLVKLLNIAIIFKQKLKLLLDRTPIIKIISLYKKMEDFIYPKYLKLVNSISLDNLKFMVFFIFVFVIVFSFKFSLFFFIYAPITWYCISSEFLLKETRVRLFVVTNLALYLSSSIRLDGNEIHVTNLIQGSTKIQLFIIFCVFLILFLLLSIWCDSFLYNLYLIFSVLLIFKFQFIVCGLFAILFPLYFELSVSERLEIKLSIANNLYIVSYKRMFLNILIFSFILSIYYHFITDIFPDKFITWFTGIEPEPINCKEAWCKNAHHLKPLYSQFIIESRRNFAILMHRNNVFDVIPDDSSEYCHPQYLEGEVPTKAGQRVKAIPFTSKENDKLPLGSLFGILGNQRLDGQPGSQYYVKRTHSLTTEEINRFFNVSKSKNSMKVDEYLKKNIKLDNFEDSGKTMDSEIKNQKKDK